MKNNYEQLLKKVYEEIDDPSQGLPEEVFLFASSITPLVNVDLLIRDDNGRILLSWRDDKYHGKGWHIPGGIIRVKETFENRIHETALKELGCHVRHRESPIEIVPIILKDNRERCHLISFIYECELPNDYRIDNGNKGEHDAGFLAWHEKFPPDMLDDHRFYRKYFRYI